MKIDRLIGILSVLLQQEMITAPELAEKFEVSRRTINRDIEVLCKAGIPIRTMQGVRRWDPHHGGIFHGQNAAEQLQKTGNVTTRKMMGEYCVYYNGKMVGDICDNTLLLKPTESAIRLLPAPKKKK